MSEFSHFGELVAAAKADGDFYWQEKVKMEFAAGIASLMSAKGISQAELARKLNVSPARISKSLRGDNNLQIETMVSMARAVGGEVHLRVCDESHRARFVSWIDGLAKQRASTFDQWVVPEDSKPFAPGVISETARAVA